MGGLGFACLTSYLLLSIDRYESLLNFLSCTGRVKCVIYAVQDEYLREFHLWLYFRSVSSLSLESLHLPSVSSIPISISLKQRFKQSARREKNRFSCWLQKSFLLMLRLYKKKLWIIPHGPIKGEITWDIAIVFSNHLPIMKWLTLPCKCPLIKSP